MLNVYHYRDRVDTNKMVIPGDVGIVLSNSAKYLIANLIVTAVSLFISMAY